MRRGYTRVICIYLQVDYGVQPRGPVEADDLMKGQGRLSKHALRQQ